MSYEGHVQRLCVKGHYYTTPYAYGEPDDTSCPDCKEACAWENHVDDTNCDSYGEIDINEFRLADPVVEPCPTCGHVRTIEPVRYRIPTEEEVKTARTRWDSEMELRVPVNR